MSIRSQLLPAALLAAAVAIAWPARAQQAPASPADIPQRVRDLERTYESADGRQFTVTSYGRTVSLRTGHRAAKLLQFDGRDAFVSRDGATTLRFEFDAGGDPRRIHVTMPTGRRSVR